MTQTQAYEGTLQEVMQEALHFPIGQRFLLIPLPNSEPKEQSLRTIEWSMRYFEGRTFQP
jgi:hypothetical protein